MTYYIQIILGGIYMGSLFGLAAIGLQVIIGTTGKVHLAYGHFWIFSSLLVSSILYNNAIPMILMFLILPIGFGLSGWIIHPRLIWTNIRLTESPRTFILLSLGLAMIMEDIGIHMWALPASAIGYAPKSIEIAGIMIPPIKVSIIIISLLVTALLSMYLRFNMNGKALRAWHAAKKDIVLVGVDQAALGKKAMALGLGIAGLAGVFLALSYSSTITEGLDMTVRSLCLAVISGTLTPWKVLGLGILLGLGEAWISLVLGAQWAPVLSYLVLFFIVFLRK